MNYEPKPLFVERMHLLLKDEEDLKKFFEFAKTKTKKSFRVNTLRISPDKLIGRLKKYNWRLKQIEGYPEIIQVQNELEPGEIGKTQEHLLGYYYIQEITSMMPIIVLQPDAGDTFLDLCASPGSKTTQAAAKMNNQGTIIANDVSIGRITILSSNLEKCGITNTITTLHDGLELCNRLKRLDYNFSKILVDAPCSGEGNIRLSPRTYLEWSEGMLERFGKKQKKLASSALELLKVGGEMIYSTCTHAPEENEEVIQHLIDNYDIEIQGVKLPIKTREGILEWRGKKFDKNMINCKRIYHHDNNMEGFFLCKIKKLSDKIKGE
ncbi:RsmB/NOP family class I SAM-dependent RNA methyltransferase [Candidatus Pacearchaeota archaeon]|nr:RsmB/NOP family class I SAM-dependent RNA methyltransferase [Candidatus Pacearchaeota archaeon]